MRKQALVRLLIACMAFGGFALIAEISEAGEPRHVIVYADTESFCGWPANNGIWIWDGREILAGFTLGTYEVKKGHNIAAPYRSVLARSLDGGEHWEMTDPDNFVGDGDAELSFPGGVDFTDSGFVLRPVGIGYLASERKQGAFFISQDRGKKWQGPYCLGSLAECEELRGAELTQRVDYIVNGPEDCLLMLSARKPDGWGTDRVFCARTTDGGLTFNFVTWVVPLSDPYRAVMPTTVRCSATKLVTVIRRRDMDKNDCWIDAYVTQDNGNHWSHLSRVADTGSSNGNPPSLVRLSDGRLCCVYGNRSKRKLFYRYSTDEGATWGQEHLLREGYDSGQNDQDFGYCRLVQREDGRLVVIYYWASPEHPQQHIAASIWEPNDQ